MTTGVFSRLTSPRKERSASTADEYDAVQQVRKSFGIVRESVPRWQSGM